MLRSGSQLVPKYKIESLEYYKIDLPRNRVSGSVSMRTLQIMGGNPIRKGITNPPVASLGTEAVTLGLSVDS